MSQPNIGLYGKLPGHGDFVTRNLPNNLVQHWDAWLQAFIGSSQERLGADWLNVYLTSPIWRFGFSAGVLDEQQWLGILMPSVDKVGRYFPFSVLVPVPGDLSLLDILCEQPEWLNPVEEAALHALDEGLLVDELLERIGDLNLPTYLRRQWCNQGYQAGPIQVPCADVQINSAMTGLLEGLLVTSYSSHSIWTTQGSDRIDACIAIAPGLPAASGGIALLDGNWNHWQWMIRMGLNINLSNP
jgi:type VI secretion system protein ImpM